MVGDAGKGSARMEYEEVLGDGLGPRPMTMLVMRQDQIKGQGNNERGKECNQ